VLCQITSKAYADSNAVEIKDVAFSNGSLQMTSYARPGKLFTANSSLIVTQAAAFKKDVFEQIVNAVIKILAVRPLERVGARALL